MDVKTLQPNRSIIKTEGNLSYGESVQGWNTIRLKKELINEFIEKAKINMAHLYMARLIKEGYFDLYIGQIIEGDSYSDNNIVLNY